MGTKVNHPHQVVIENKDTTVSWGKDSAGCTKEELKTIYHKETGNVTDAYGKIISNNKK